MSFFGLILTFRFLWVDLQLKAIRDAYDDDRTLNRVLILLKVLPEDLKLIYAHALQSSLEHRPGQIDIIRKIFSWVICAKRPISIQELDEAISIVVGQQFWKKPAIKFTSSTLSKRCGNLIICDQYDGSVLLAHHSVRSFLDTSNEISGLGTINFQNLQNLEANTYIAQTCITYLNFTDFRKSLTTTRDFEDLRYLNSPLLLATQPIPRRNMLHPIGLWNKYSSSKQSTSSRPFDVVNHLIHVQSSNRFPPIGYSSPLLDYSKLYWHQHCRELDTYDSAIFSVLKLMVFDSSSPFRWQP